MVTAFPATRRESSHHDLEHRLRCSTSYTAMYDKVNELLQLAAADRGRLAFTALLIVVSGVVLVACNDEDHETPTPLAAEATATPVPTATPVTPEPTPTVSPTPDASPTPDPTPTPAPTATPEPTPEPQLVEYGYRIVNTFPHDHRAFTQGLEYSDGYLYESTGLRGESSLRQVELETGEVTRIHELDERYFGEGLTILDGLIYQLTWHAEYGFVYDLETFEPLHEVNYEGEGWGLATDGERIIMSDGSNRLYYRDPETFDEVGHVDVYDDDGPVMMLNELEYIDGEIWANIWMEDIIVVIDPSTGQVTARIDLTGLLQPEDRGDRRVDVLNGIAYDDKNRRIFVTGKLWPVLYEIELVLQE